MVSMMVSYDDYLRHLTVMVIVAVIGVGYGVTGINKYREIGNGSAVKIDKIQRNNSPKSDKINPNFQASRNFSSVDE